MFSLNSLNSVTKIFVITTKQFRPFISCAKDQDATNFNASKTDVRHMIFNLTPVHASMILDSDFPYFIEFYSRKSPMF